MLFNSFTFLYFFALVFPLYLVLARRWQNLLLLAASLIFYGWWDWRYLGVLVATMLVDYVAAGRIDGAATPRARRAWLGASLGCNLAVLGFFKYAGFFAETVNGLIGEGGEAGALPVLGLALPVGVSFYTFQSMSYTIDVYRRRLPACRAPLDYALFVGFFPQLVAGPIERAAQLLPQVQSDRRVTPAGLREGVWLLLYGYFLKTVVADNLAPLVDELRSGSPLAMGAGELWLGLYTAILMFYADFGGYSCIARGLARLMGFDLMFNFRRPFFAANPADFWRRWHISLSEWFRDYVFTPMTRLVPSARRRGAYVGFCAAATLLLCGLWHGPAWNFVAFGAYHGVLLVAYYALRPRLRRLKWRAPATAALWRGAGRILVFHLLAFGAVIFVVPDPRDSVRYAGRLLGTGALALSRLGTAGALSLSEEWQTLLALAALVGVLEGLQERARDPLVILRAPRWARWPTYALLFALIVLCGATGTHEFVYFQF